MKLTYTGVNYSGETDRGVSTTETPQQLVQRLLAEKWRRVTVTRTGVRVGEIFRRDDVLHWWADRPGTFIAWSGSKRLTKPTDTGSSA